MSIAARLGPSLVVVVLVALAGCDAATDPELGDLADESKTFTLQLTPSHYHRWEVACTDPDAACLPTVTVALERIEQAVYDYTAAGMKRTTPFDLPVALISIKSDRDPSYWVRYNVRMHYERSGKVGELYLENPEVPDAPGDDPTKNDTFGMLMGGPDTFSVELLAPPATDPFWKDDPSVDLFVTLGGGAAKEISSQTLPI